MLRIRPEQRLLMQLAIRCQFESDLVEHVRVELPTVHRDTPRELLRARISWAQDRATKWGFERRVDLQSCVVLLLGIGPGLENHPVVREVFGSRILGAANKLENLLGRMTVDDWRAVRTSTIPSDWPEVA